MEYINKLYCTACKNKIVETTPDGFLLGFLYCNTCNKVITGNDSDSFIQNVSKKECNIIEFIKPIKLIEKEK